MHTSHVTLGAGGLRVGPIGLGCMGMSQFYGPADRAESIATVRLALDLGVNLLDTADVYGAVGAAADTNGFGHNETLLGEAVRGRRDRAVIATKFGARPSDDGRVVYDGTPAYVRSACEASLRRLGTDHIDLYYCHRLDPAVPVEETVGAMAELVAEGKVTALGLSNAGPDELRRAARTAPISAPQSEYSLWERGVEDEILPLCRKLGIALVPYSPLGRAALTGRVGPGTRLDGDDFRSTLPKFSPGNLPHNLRLVDGLKRFARERGVTPGQVALAWLLAQPHAVVPVPGTKRAEFLRENAAAADLTLDGDEVAALGALFAPGRVRGGQYGELPVSGR
ncbi:aldo/keto reductase [Streptomyces sp. NPDC044984]|uniref:aldo/keto reductase n=1 Tax=Streptomyces sp. NPDC044984 TaxID=3154335 RepID=UPI0033E14A15